MNHVMKRREQLLHAAVLAPLLILVAALASAPRLLAAQEQPPAPDADHAPEPSGPSPFDVIAENLSNPRDIAIDDGAFYVSEAGPGGSSPCVDSYNGGYRDCYGASGSITRISRGRVERLIRGLPSLAGPNRGFGVGAAHLFLRDHSLFAVIANGGDPARRAILKAADPRFGSILELRPGRRSRIAADLSAFEDAANPDGRLAESNPSGFAPGRSGGFWAVDAGANTLLRITARGAISLRYVFPERALPAPAQLGLPAGATLPVQSVPTAIVQGPDGAYYIGEFTGFPYPEGAARVFRFDGRGDPEVYASGFTNIIDLEVGPDGSLYVVELATHGLFSGDPTGAVVKLSRGGRRVARVSAGLVHPTAIAVDRRSRVYVANFGLSGRRAQLVRLPR